MKSAISWHTWFSAALTVTVCLSGVAQGATPDWKAALDMTNSVKPADSR
jgi:hypothetical protein